MNTEEIYLQAYEQFQAKNYDAAFELVEEMKNLAPDYRKAHLLEIRLLDQTEDYPKLILAVKKFLPNINLSTTAGNILAADLLDLLAHAQRHLAMNEAAFKNLKLAAQMSIDNTEATIRHASAIYCAVHIENFSATDFRILYAGYKKYLSDITPYPKKFYRHERIRVGFMSGDFGRHAAMKWAWALIHKLNRNFFTTFCYNNRKDFDKITDHVAAMTENWRDISNLDDAQAAELIRNDEIDILFDLSGHTAGNRLRVAAYHPASIQLCGVGYMNSTGLDCFDYFLSDEICAAESEKYFVEKLIRLPHSHICFEPAETLEISAPPCLEKNFVTFGSFNQFSKITDSMLKVWKKILDAVPDSRLILKNKISEKESGRDFIRNRLKKFGIDVARVEMRGLTKNYLREYGDVDIALDTFPYTGGVTTCEALYMGVPVVSLYGERHGSRFGLSILKNVGLDELAVDSYDDYINRAVMLANDWELLGLLRKNLRGMMEKSPLMDSKKYIREVSAALITILHE